MKKIILVGNAAPKKDYSLLIDSYDIVIRFNHVNYLATGYIGKKCDILVVQNMDEKYRTGNVAAHDCKEIIIIAENKTKDYSDIIVSANNWRKKPYSIVYSDNLEIKEKLNIKGGSSGFIILEWLLKERESDQSHISLVCFTWEGWSGHAWEKEKMLCHDYEERGLLSIIK